MAKDRKCARCGRPSSGLIGSECLKVAIEEAEQFCQDVLGETREQFALMCDTDFASDEGLTVEQYRAKYGGSIMLADDTEFIQTMLTHGLWGRQTRSGRI
jgi:hypothetical protein